MSLAAAGDDGGGDDAGPLFPRLEATRETSLRADAPGSGRADEVLLEVHQHKGKLNSEGYEVRRAEDGSGAVEIPMSVTAAAAGTWIPREVVVRSPWLARCLESPEGAVLARSLAGEECLEGQDDGNETALGTGVTCRRTGPQAIELVLPLRGAGRRLLDPRGALQCLNLAAPQSAFPFDAFSVSASTLLSFFLWAAVLEMDSVAKSCREAMLASVDVYTVALALAAGYATADEELLRRCYWCLREAMCGAAGVPRTWLDGRGPTKLARGCLSYTDICSSPLRVLADIAQEDMAAKRKRWQVPTDCYTLCQVHRIRSEDGAYPHTYEMRLDHSDEVVMRALREDEQSSCRIFGSGITVEALATASSHCPEYLGCVEPNFWGTVFTLFDSGTDVDTVSSRCKEATQLPLRPRSPLCTVGYETNLLGDCPRKVTVDFDRGTTRHHFENMAPRWDKKLKSYALPFFGRVKKASAKNFQLVVDNDPNTIFLMFGKISKDVFCLDYRGPIAPLDAMAIAIAALAKKRAVS